MARFTSAAWADKTMRETAEGRRKLMRELSSGVHEITDDSGQPVDLSPPPSRVDVAPLPPFAVRDRYGRVIQEAAPARTDVAPVSKGFSLGDRAAFEDCISDQPADRQAELRAWYDQEVKKHGIE